ncbi:hypothetical protein J6590_026795 [Homalodisca vitripennis]|nr:hypothetical protein J6590_026795 [Homalodisca vitripennis]
MGNVGQSIPCLTKGIDLHFWNAQCTEDKASHIKKSDLTARSLEGCDANPLVKPKVQDLNVAPKKLAWIAGGKRDATVFRQPLALDKTSKSESGKGPPRKSSPQQSSGDLSQLVVICCNLGVKHEHVQHPEMAQCLFSRQSGGFICLLGGNLIVAGYFNANTGGHSHVPRIRSIRLSHPGYNICCGEPLQKNHGLEEFIEYIHQYITCSLIPKNQMSRSGQFSEDTLAEIIIKGKVVVLELTRSAGDTVNSTIELISSSVLVERRNHTAVLKVLQPEAEDWQMSSFSEAFSGTGRVTVLCQPAQL